MCACVCVCVCVCGWVGVFGVSGRAIFSNAGVGVTVFVGAWA